jgi:hypothetical protein
MIHSIICPAGIIAAYGVLRLGGYGFPSIPKTYLGKDAFGTRSADSIQSIREYSFESCSPG